MRQLRRPLTALALATLLGAPLACGPREPGAGDAGPTLAGQRVENPHFGFAIASLPQGLSLQTSDTTGIELTGRTEKGPGRMTITANEPQPSGVNLVEEVKAQKERALVRSDGQFLGQVELGTPYGTAYAARSRYRENGTEMEEQVLFALHPAGDNRLMTVTYVYPAGGDTEERRDQLLAVAGEIEPLAGPTPDSATTGMNRTQ